MKAISKRRVGNKVAHPTRLHKSGLCKQYPEAVLRLLAAVIDDPPWAPQKLDQCLDDIV